MLVNRDVVSGSGIIVQTSTSPYNNVLLGAGAAGLIGTTGSTGLYGYYNTAVGGSALANIADGNYNTAIGYNTLPGLTGTTYVNGIYDFIITSTGPALNPDTPGPLTTVNIVSSTTLPGEANNQYNNIVINTTSGSGTGAQCNVQRDEAGAVSTVEVSNGGTGYTSTSGLSINGADVGGATPTDNITMSVARTEDIQYSNVPILSTSGTGTGALITVNRNRITGLIDDTWDTGYSDPIGDFYAVNDTFTLAGANLGGTTPTNNSTFTITTVGDENLGVGNVAIGANAAVNVKDYNYGIYIGHNSGYRLPNPVNVNYNDPYAIAIGYDAKVSEGRDIAIGYKSRTGNASVSIGYSAGAAASGAFRNVAIGPYTLGGDEFGVGCTTQESVAIGNSALKSLTKGNSNTAIGYQAGFSCTTGANNCFYGWNSGYGCSTGTRNTFFGAESGRLVTTGYGNCFLGHRTSYNTSTGFNNTCVGNGAGTGAENSGSNNTCLGFNATYPSSTGSNTITLGNSAIATLRCQVTTITALSDARDKKDIADLPVGMDFVEKLRPVEFVWNTRDGEKVGMKDTGFVAQELLQAQKDIGYQIPHLVDVISEDRLEAGVGTLIPVMVKALKDLSARVAELEKARV